jgi:hypothetical protein
MGELIMGPAASAGAPIIQGKAPMTAASKVLRIFISSPIEIGRQHGEQAEHYRILGEIRMKFLPKRKKPRKQCAANASLPGPAAYSAMSAPTLMAA